MERPAVTEPYDDSPRTPHGGLLMEVEYRPDEGTGYMPVPCVTGLLRGTAAVVADHATGAAAPMMLQCAQYLASRADEIAYHLAVAQVQASLEAGDDVAADEALHRGGVFNPRNWFTRRR